MIIRFSPTRMDCVLSVSVQGDTLVVNGEAVDLDAPVSDWVRAAERVDGQWEVLLLLPHGPDADRSALFPEPVEVTQDGPVTLPGQPAAT